MRSTTPQVQQLLLNVVRANPGIHVRRLALLAGLSWNTVLYHVRAMSRLELVSVVKLQGKVCLFDRSRGAVKDKEATCLLRDADNVRLARQILASPGASQLQLATTLDMAASAVHRRVTRMETVGLVVRVPANRCMQVFPSDALEPVAQRGGLFGSSLAARPALPRPQGSASMPVPPPAPAQPVPPLPAAAPLVQGQGPSGPEPAGIPA